MAAATSRLKLSDPIDVFGFKTRVYNRLRIEGIHTVGDLLKFGGGELLDFRFFGPRCLYEVIDTLARHGLKLKESTGPLPDRPQRTARPFAVNRRPRSVDEQAIRERIAQEILGSVCPPGEQCPDRFCPDCIRYEQAKRDARIARGEHTNPTTKENA